MHYLTRFYQGLIAAGHFLQPFFLLAIRLFWGWQFFKAGFDKFGQLNSVADYFGAMGIPFPLLSAFLTAAVEMVGGLFFMLGLASRLVAIPLMFTMVVALFVAYPEQTFMIFDDPVKVLQLTPFTFLIASMVIFIFGPGAISLDGAIKKWKQESSV